MHVSNRMGIKTLVTECVDHENQKHAKTMRVKVKPDSETSLHSTCAFHCRTITSFHLYCKITQQDSKCRPCLMRVILNLNTFCIKCEHKCTTSELVLV